MGWKLLPDLSVPKVNIAANVLSSLRETAMDRVAFEPLTMTLGQFKSLPRLHFPHLGNGDKNSSHSRWWGAVRALMKC